MGPLRVIVSHYLHSHGTCLLFSAEPVVCCPPCTQHCSLAMKVSKVEQTLTLENKLRHTQPYTVEILPEERVRLLADTHRQPLGHVSEGIPELKTHFVLAKKSDLDREQYVAVKF